MCFGIIAGRETTAGGHVIMGGNDDWPGYPGHIRYEARRHNPEGSSRVLVGGREIPEVPVTAARILGTCAYATGTFPESWAFGLNENLVSVVMMGVYAFRSVESAGGLEGDDLTVLALERGRTARQTVEMLGDLISRYGFSVSTIDGASGAVVVGVADPEEGWWLEAVPGGAWAAQLVPDDQVSWRPNCFGIQEIDFQDQDNFLHSPDLKEFAQNNGWYSGSGPFIFASVFGAAGQAICAYGNEDGPINSHRRWHAQRLISGREQALEDKVYQGRPQRPVTAALVRDLLRDSTEGSRYDLSLAPEAGSHRNPFWMEVGTGIGQSGTVLSLVAELRRDLPPEIGGLLWLACANTRLAPFFPCYIGGRGLPESFARGEFKNFTEDSAWWIFQELGEVCYRNYEEVARKKVIPAIGRLEQTFWDSQTAFEKNFLLAWREDPELAAEMMSAYNHTSAERALALARKLIHQVKSHNPANLNL